MVDELFTIRGAGDCDLRFGDIGFGVTERVRVDEGREAGVDLVREEP